MSHRIVIEMEFEYPPTFEDVCNYFNELVEDKCLHWEVYPNDESNQKENDDER
tara:strand:+ start:1108 stop:1266 length:159 start_codon:yes stop_codon:yes gene_type:complete